MADSMVFELPNNLIYSNTKRKVARLGIEGIVVVDTPDALLVADMKNSQGVKNPVLMKIG